MRLLSLNTWGATQGQVFFDYIAEQSRVVDIFCFQEVFAALPGAPAENLGARMFLFDELINILPGFNRFFDSSSTGFGFNGSVVQQTSQGPAIFVKEHLRITDYRSYIIEQTGPSDDPVEGWIKSQVMTIGQQLKKISVVNFHGMAQPGNKLDTPQRIAHAQKLGLIWESLPTDAKILCGDFNIYPDIESIKLLESRGRNLITEFGIKNTRNEISWEKFKGQPKQHFADFTFVSKAVKVKSFEVPYNLVSDHLPMVLEFDF